jgi:hypothetical protein
MLPQAILKYLQVYHAILMANNRFCIDSQCPSLLSLVGDAALDAVLEWIRPEVSRLVGFRRQSRRSLFLRSGFQTIDCSAIAAVCDTARSLISHLGSLSVIKMEEKNNAGEGSRFGFVRLAPPSDEILCVYCHFLVECFCVSAPQEKVPGWKRPMAHAITRLFGPRLSQCRLHGR